MIFMTGCGKQKTSQTEEGVQNEADEEISIEEKDNVSSTEKEADTIAPSEEYISDKQDDPIRSITVYYVDDGSAEVVGKRVDVSNEFDVWNALKENGILGKCQKKVINRGGTVIERAELMSIILKKNIDISMKRQLSFIYDMILDLETENKTYITHIKVSNDSEEKILAFIKSEI